LNNERVLSAALYDASIGRADPEAQKRGAKRALELQLAAGIARVDRPDGWNVHLTPDAVELALGAAAKFDLPAAVPNLVMPVLVATGDNDPNLASSRELVDKAPNAHLVVLENVGHGSVLQRPDLATKTYLEFQASMPN
jgi:pimeloyl-ACP methyl ester carboxylesterase